ncbi:MAG: o-succinylbenzoate synthase [Chloroflexi bacterium]|nr:o-succinylbenzoate synthase [Chloroflexota bacterium]
MRIERAELFLLRLPLRRPYETSMAVETHETHVIVRVEDSGAVGWGESVANETPWYSGETPSTVWVLLEEVLVPHLRGRTFAHPREVSEALAWVRDARMAKAAIEMAMWDLAAKQAGVPLSALLGGTRERILCGVAIGLHPTLEALLERIEEELRGGYRRVKLKIKPGRDAAIAEAVRSRWPDLPFMLDANSAYTLADAPVFERIDATRPTMIEQPLAHDDMIDHAALQARIRTPICLDESIRHADDARKAISIGATKVINIKPGRVGGHAEAVRIHDTCLAAGVPVWCGGMLEMGVGRAHNVHLASLPGFSLPGDVAASKRYFETEIIGEPFEVEPGGTMKVPAGPGIGVSVLEREIRRLALGTAELR